MIPILPRGYRKFKVGERVRCIEDVDSTDFPPKRINKGSVGKIVNKDDSLDVFTIEFEPSLRAWVVAIMMGSVFEHAGPVIEERPIPPQLLDWYKQTQKHINKKKG